MDVRSLTDSCISVIQECSFIALRLEQFNRNYKGVPPCVIALAEELDKWMEPLLVVHHIVRKGRKLLDTALRARLSDHWDHIKALLDDGMGLIDEFDQEKHVREKAFIGLAESFKEERGRIHTWIDVAQLKVKDIDIIANNTSELKEMVNKLLDEVRRPRNSPVQRQDSNQFPTDLDRPADGELQGGPIQEKSEGSKKKMAKAVPTREKGESSKKKKGKAVDKQAAGAVSLPSGTLHSTYVDCGIQTEPLASTRSGHTLPPRSQFRPKTDLTEPSGFPFWVDGQQT